MKKLAIVTSLLALSLTAFADSYTVTIATGTMSNLVSGFGTSAKVSQVVLTAPAANTATIKLLDTPGARLAYTNPPYSTLTTYATNVITVYTNFFGATNSITNIALVDIVSTVASNVVTYPSHLTATAPTNSSVLFNGSYYFNNGVWATNTGSGDATVSVTFTR